MDPISMLAGGGGLDITGGDAAPSSAFSDGQQTVNAWMDSPFSVGTGSTATSTNPVSTGMDGAPGVGSSAVSSMVPWIVGAVVAVAAIQAFAK